MTKNICKFTGLCLLSTFTGSIIGLTQPSLANSVQGAVKVTRANSASAAATGTDSTVPYGCATCKDDPCDNLYGW